MTTFLNEWENKGWTNVKNATFFKKAVYLLRKRLATTSFKWIKGHNSEEGNEQSDQLAKQGAMKDRDDNLDLEVPKEFDP